MVGQDLFDDIVKTADYRKFPLSRNIHAIPIFNHILEIYIRKVGEDEIADFNCARHVLQFCRDQVTTLVGTLDAEVLLRIVQTVVQLSHLDARKLALNCVCYAAENRLPEANKMVKVLLEKFSNFDEVEKKQLNQLFAHETEWINLV